MYKRKDDSERKPVEQEIAELQRKFRLLENDKRAYSEDSQAIIRKQRASIEKLTRENRQLKQDLNETRAGAASRNESKQAALKLQTIQEKKDTLLTKEQLLLEDRRRITSEVEDLRKQTWNVREDLCKRGGVNAARENHEAVAKQIRVLENRLDKSLQKFNEAVAHNKEQREAIDALRRERVVFDQIYKKLEQELQQKKKEMANIIEQANAAYEARDQAQAQMASLKQQADKEHQEFEREWKELGRLIENDKKMKEFMRQKERTRLVEEKKGREAEELARVTKKVNKTAWNVAKDKANVHLSLEKLQSYEEAFAKMQAATGISDIDELVENFIAAEDQNFSLFTYANELSGEIEQHETDIADLKANLEVLKGTGQTGKKQQLVELEERWGRTDKLAEHYELKYQQAVKTLSAVRAGVQSIFNRLGPAVRQMMGQAEIAAGVTESTMRQYLGVIEERAQELLSMHAMMQMREGVEDESVPIRSTRGPLQIRLPSTVEDYSDEEEDDDEEDQRPFTREELKLKTMRGIQKRQEKKKAGRHK